MKWVPLIVLSVLGPCAMLWLAVLAGELWSVTHAITSTL